MEKTIQNQVLTRLSSLDILLASFALVLGSWVTIPLQPVPITGQTLALFAIALTLSPKRAFMSVLLYLGYATLGLPVLSNFQSNPLWMLSMRVGYLVAFPFVAYVTSSLSNYFKRSFFGDLLAIFSGKVVLYCLGLSGLMFHGLSLSQAFSVGLLPFILPAGFKLLALLTTFQLLHRYGK